VTFLTAKSLYLGDRDASDAHVGECFTDIIKLKGLDDCRNHFHAVTPQSLGPPEGGPMI
jgi:hypothetical protein